MSFAPGSLVRARDREWVVLPDSEPDFLVLRPLGGTDDEIAGLLPALETVEAATFAAPDPRFPGDAQSCRLLRDALRLGFRGVAGPFRSFGRIYVEPRPYQLVPLLMALDLDPVRLLIADDVGIGKTVEACLIARELLDRGEITRLCVLCPPHLAEQWQRELASKFQLDATLVLASTAARLERGLAQFRSVFEEHPITVVSLDYIKSKTRRDSFLRTAPEFIIVDEAHTCADTPEAGSGRQLRHQLLRELVAADPNRHMVLVTATPHSGKDQAFRSLLTLLDPAFADLPDDLSSGRHDKHRQRLARHLVQRRRADIRAYLDQETKFPERLELEPSPTYSLTPAWNELYGELLDYARETVASTRSDEPRRQRLRWWSVLALLRALASSPPAAIATLRNRARNLTDPVGDSVEATDTRAIDARGQASVMDLADHEPTDVVPTCDLGDVDPDDDGDGAASTTSPKASERRRLRAFARRAGALQGDADPKLIGLVPVLRKLLTDGYSPIVFCRFIPTVQYLVEELRERLGKKVEIRGVTGELPPEDREQRVNELIQAETQKRILIATDCLSEGINLQHGFDAVVHYDLAWNPTRHEQREGRVDRFGQQRPEVRVVTYYGRDNGIDGLVLEVLLTKHRTIRKTLGISVPVPVDSEAVLAAVLEGAILRRGNVGVQLSLPLAGDEGSAEGRALAELEQAWNNAAAKEKASTSPFAQHRRDPRLVADELAAAREALGGAPEIRRFLIDAVRAHGGTVSARSATAPAANALDLDLRELPRGLREALFPTAAPPSSLLVSTDPDGGAELLHRAHPLVTNLAAWVLDRALTDPEHAVAKRCGLIRTRGVTTRTTLLLLRLRHRFTTERPDRRRVDDQPGQKQSSAGAEPGSHHQLLEEAALAAFTGGPGNHRWLDDIAIATLLDLGADQNVATSHASHVIESLLAEIGALGPELDSLARQRAARALDAHHRVRQASSARPNATVTTAEPQLPVDLLGVYVFLPLLPGQGPIAAGPTARGAS